MVTISTSLSIVILSCHYSTIVVYSSAIDDISKFQYLQASLEGDALEAIKSLTLKLHIMNWHGIYWVIG